MRPTMATLLRVAGSTINSLKQMVVKAQSSRNTYTAEEYGPYGTDSRPIAKTTVLYFTTQQDGDEAIMGCLNKNRLADTGEHRTFSTDDDGNLKFYIWQRKDGTVSIGGEDNFAVKFNELKTEFNSLKSDHNALVQKWNAFCTAYVPGSPVITGSPATLASSTVSANNSNIDNAKNDKIKTI